MIPEGTESSAVTPEQITAVANDVVTFCASFSPKIPLKEVARAIGYSPGVVSDFCQGKYKGNQGQVAIDLESWLVEEEARRSRPATTQFVWTNVAMAIKSVASYCLDKRKVGMVYGPETSGIGKTTALRAIAQELGPRRCTLLTVEDVDANSSNLLQKILSAMGKDDKGSNAVKYRRIVDHLKGRSHLLILDQIHNLRDAKHDKPFYNLMDLFDAETGAQLWCGTADLVAYLDRKRQRVSDSSLTQIRRRIFPVVDLMEGVMGTGGGNGEPLVTVDQVREMFAKNKLRLTQAAARFLAQICNHPDGGSVGLCVQIVEYATMMGNLTSIDVPLLQQAMRRGFTPARAHLILAKMEAEQQPTRAAKVG